MRTVNRSAVVVVPKQPFLVWLKQVDPGSDSLRLADLQENASVYLIPECEDEDAFIAALAGLYDSIFREQLESWIQEEALWPLNRSLTLFQQWFHYRRHLLVFDSLSEVLALTAEE